MGTIKKHITLYKMVYSLMIFYRSSNFQSTLVIFTYFYNTKVQNIFNDFYRPDIIAVRI